MGLGVTIEVATEKNPDIKIFPEQTGIFLHTYEGYIIIIINHMAKIYPIYFLT